MGPATLIISFMKFPLADRMTNETKFMMPGDTIYAHTQTCCFCYSYSQLLALLVENEKNRDLWVFCLSDHNLKKCQYFHDKI